jgi:broad specificity phosphatase PhoE
MTTVHFVRHGETVTHRADAGLTVAGVDQARARGRALADELGDHESVEVAYAPTERARRTAEELHGALLDALTRSGRSVRVAAPTPTPDFHNFRVRVPDGVRDPSQAYAAYHATSKRLGDASPDQRPTWVMDMERFYERPAGELGRVAFWLTVPLVSFEPPSLVVERFLTGLARLSPPNGTTDRLICATHSGPMRALAAWALAGDPGEPDHAEEVRVGLRAPGATLSFRGRTQQVRLEIEHPSPAWEPVAQDMVNAGSEERRSR